ncbi:MAG: F0F1 ATP synthase subunit A [Chitinophagales bacterium]
MYSIRYIFVVLWFGLGSIFVSNCLHAQEHHATETAHETVEQHDAGDFSVKDFAMHHIGDSNELDFLGVFKIPLPCIIYKDGSFDVFMSSVFEHGAKTYKSYELHHGKIATTDGSSFIDFSITKNVVGMLLVALLMFWLFTGIAAAYKKRANQAPSGKQSLFEPLISFIIDDVAKPNIGEHKYKKFVPYLLTVFFFILFLNLLGLIPLFSFNVTGNIAVTLILSIITFILVNINGTKDYWQHILWMPGVPVVLKPLMAVLEFIGIFTKPFALMIRLFANISAGHIIIMSLICLIFIFGKMGESLGGAAMGAGIAIPFVLFMYCLELLVAFLQAYIFTMLSALFIGLAVAEHDEHH